MGGRGSNSGKSSASVGSQVPHSSKITPVEPNKELQLDSGQAVTKVAEKAFNNTYSSIRRGMEVFGEDESLSVKPDFGEQGYVSKRTLKGVQHKITAEQHSLDIASKLNAIPAEKIRAKRLALNAMQRGLNSLYMQYKKDGWA